MDSTETLNKVPLATKTAPVVRQAVENLANADERTLSQMVELLLKENPRIRAEMKRIQESEAVATA